MFLYTGLYMRMHFPAAYQGHEAIRFLYRANHLYIMFASIVNVALGRYFAVAAERWGRVWQTVGSVAVIVAVPILIGAFFYEPQLGGTLRTMTLVGCILALSGGVLQGVAGRTRR